MTDLRDKIAKVVAKQRHSENCQDEWWVDDCDEALADAIIALLSDSVKPLEWGEWNKGYSHHTWNSLNAMRSAKTVFGAVYVGRKYAHTKIIGEHKYSEDWWLELPWAKNNLLGPIRTDVEAIDVANTEVASRILSAMGLAKC